MNVFGAGVRAFPRKDWMHAAGQTAKNQTPELVVVSNPCERV